jgi:hypothetical protein
MERRPHPSSYEPGLSFDLRWALFALFVGMAGLLYGVGT